MRNIRLEDRRVAPADEPHKVTLLSDDLIDIIKDVYAEGFYDGHYSSKSTGTDKGWERSETRRALQELGYDA